MDSFLSFLFFPFSQRIISGGERRALWPRDGAISVTGRDQVMTSHREEEEEEEEEAAAAAAEATCAAEDWSWKLWGTDEMQLPSH